MKHPEDNKTMDILDPVTKPRGRPTLAPAEAIPDTFDTDAASHAAMAANELANRQAEIADKFGDGLQYERERVIHEASFFMAQSAEAMLEAGKRLIQIKENEPHGDFINIVTERLGLGERTARSMMQASLKYLSPRLEAKRQSIAVLGKSKLFDLMAESDDDIEALAEGGTLAGHTLDEFEAMTRREMQAALRDAKQQIEAKDKVLQDRNQKLQDAEERLHKPFKPSKNAAARTAAEKAALDALQAAVATANDALNTVVEVITDMSDQGVSHTCLTAAHNDITWLAHRIANVLRDQAIPLDLEAEVVPSWVREHVATHEKGGA